MGYCTARAKCDIIAASMRKSAIETLSRVCAILPASRLAVAAALLCFLAPAARANSVWDAVQAGHLTWGNATTNWLANGDLVIKYNTGAGRGSV